MTEKPKSLLAAASIAIGLAFTGCATPRSAAVPDDVLQTYPVGDIITGGVREGHLRLADGCLILETDRWNYTVFFPDGSTLSADKTAVLLPDGDAVVVGRRYSLLLEYYPLLQNTNSSCAGDPNALVRSIFRGE